MRESGSIEQDADVVMFIFREEYYLERDKPTQHANEKDDHYASKVDSWEQRLEKSRNLAEVLVSKQRHGPTGDVTLQFQGEFTRFSNFDRHHTQD